MSTVVGKSSGTVFPLDPRAVIGRGGEGVVYRAGTSAVKVFLADLDGTTVTKLDTLIRFARVVPGFAWPTETVHETTGGKAVGYVMRLATGESLEALMGARRTASIPTETKVAVAANIARAVAGAHGTGGLNLCLGDVLKAGNIVIAGDSATLVDAASVSLFGFRAADGSLTDSVTHLATPGYIPPEVLAHPQAKPSRSADLFALGVVLFELVFGRSPTEPRPCAAAVGLDPDDAVRRGLFVRYVTHPDFTPPKYDPVAVPAEIEDLFRAAFLGGPHQRPTAGEWIARLDEWRASLRPARAAMPAARNGWWERIAGAVPWVERMAVALLAVTSVVLLGHWLLFNGPDAFKQVGARLFPPKAPSAPDPPPAKPVGPPLFRELFK